MSGDRSGTAGGTAARTIRVPGYDVTVGPGLLDSAADAIRRAAPAHRTVVVTDTNVLAHHEAAARQALAPLGAEWLAIPPGEWEKSRERWAWLTDRMLDLGCGRDTTVVALGGGVVGDLAGFVAATYMRGVPVVQLPTSLLAMVDASVGGKTAIDVPAGKNLVGAFHRPSAVVADVRLLRTLPAAERRSGMAEVLKHGVVADAVHLADAVAALPALLDDDRFDEAAAADLVARSVAIKAEVVAADEREGGRRKILNFGHTLGHAVEQASGYRLPHGEAVAIGMVLEATLAERVGVADAGTAAAVEGAVRAAGLPVAVPPDLDPDLLVRLTRSDKKARGGQVEYALPAAVGRMAGEGSGWGVGVGDEVVLAVLRERTGAG